MRLHPQNLQPVARRGAGADLPCRRRHPPSFDKAPECSQWLQSSSRAGSGVVTRTARPMPPNWHHSSTLRVGEPAAYATGSPELKAVGPCCTVYYLPDHQRIEGARSRGRSRATCPGNGGRSLSQNSAQSEHSIWFGPEPEAVEHVSPIVEWLRALGILMLIAGFAVAGLALPHGPNIPAVMSGLAVIASALPVFAMARGLLLLERIAKSSGEAAAYMGKLAGRATATAGPRQSAQPTPAARSTEKREPRLEDR